MRVMMEATALEAKALICLIRSYYCTTAAWTLPAECDVDRDTVAIAECTEGTWHFTFLLMTSSSACQPGMSASDL